MLTTIALTAIAVLILAFVVGTIIGRQNIDSDPLDAEALQRISEAKIAQKNVPIMLRKQCD